MIQNIFIFLISTLFIVGCDFRKPPDEDTAKQIDKVANQNLIYDETPIYDEDTSKYPNDIDKFKDVLSRSKYQYPDSNTTVEYDQFDGYKTKNFYVDANDDFYFILKKEKDSTKVRDELRQGPESGEWVSSDSDGNFWVSTIRCFKPKVGVSTYTWMQIHGTIDTFNYPLLRLLWVRSRHDIYDHLWAIVITSNPDDERVYDWVDLGKRPDDFFDASVYVKENTMKIKINGEVIKRYEVDYWEDVTNYFKAGIYLNIYKDEGEGTIAYRELHFLDEADPEYVQDP